MQNAIHLFGNHLRKKVFARNKPEHQRDSGHIAHVSFFDSRRLKMF